MPLRPSLWDHSHRLEAITLQSESGASRLWQVTVPELPVFEVMDELCSALKDHGAAVLIAPPGTGKTTAVAPVLLGEAWAESGRIILVEPRRIAARAAATRMAEMHQQVVGQLFGYAVRGERQVSAQTRVEVLTEGLFLRRIQSDPELSGVSAVLLDEFHERSLDSDLLLALLMDLRSSLRPDLRLLVMSATLDPSPVAALLGSTQPRGSETAPAVPSPVIEAVAKMYPVETRYRPGSAHDPLEERVAAVIQEALRTDPGDILVFLPGRPEIFRVARVLDRSGSGSGSVIVRQLHGSLSPAEQQEIIQGHEAGQRRVVLSTSLAETSITVPGVRVVIDAGRRRVVRTDPHSGLPALRTTAVSQAGADQRRGRAGRTAPGVAYRLWAENEHRHRPIADTPEILDGDLSAMLLQLLVWGVENPASLRWIDEPPERGVDQAQLLLSALGAIDAEGRLTKQGRALGEIGFHPRLAAVAEAGRSAGAADLAAVVVAVLETSRSGEIDLVERARELAAGHGSGDAQHAVQQWRRTLGASRDGRSHTADLLDSEQIDALLGRLLLAGYPDRISRKRKATRTDDQGKSRVVFHLRSGGEVALPTADHGFNKTTWLVVADLDGGATARAGRLYLGAAISEDTVREVLGAQILTEDTVEWNARERRVTATRQSRLGAITFGAQPLSNPPQAALHAALNQALSEEGLQLLGRFKEADSLRARVALLRATNVGEQSWPDWSNEHLTETLSDWLGPFLDRAKTLKDLNRIDVRAALQSQLSWEQTSELPELAPTHWVLPTGKKIPLHYGQVDGEPATVLASVRLRELIGCDEHPVVGAQRVAVTVELLSPAGRPVQRTNDLPGFWRGSYSAVRTEMRGRYPKHPWPEKPWEPLPAKNSPKR